MLTVEEAVAAYMDLQLRRAAAATLPANDGQTPDTNIWEETVARLCSRLHFPERFLSAYARLLACRLLPEWAIWGLCGRLGPLGSDKLSGRLEGIPIHIRLARARRAAGDNHAAYRAFFENSDTPYNHRAVGTVDVFSDVAATVCALELRVWEAIQHAFEARCPVPPEEQWRVRQVISDIAAASETMLLYARHVQQKKTSLAPRAEVVSSDTTAAEASPVVENAVTGAGQQLQRPTVQLKYEHATSDRNPETQSEPTVSTGTKHELTCRFEALVLTKTAWEMYLPLGAPETSRHATQQLGPDVLLGQLHKQLVNTGGLKIPKELHTHLEAFSSMYKTHFPERQLLWLWRAGHADMTVILRQQPHATQRHAGTCAELKAADFRVCLLASFVLLLFNEYDFVANLDDKMRQCQLKFLNNQWGKMLNTVGRIPLISVQTAAQLIGISAEEALVILEGLQIDPQNLLNLTLGVCLA
ncbi:uncharacterized protein EMH_0001360 [Eimeria mitis]|uniref:Cullin family profile domain-containing protein n=1 Tax=Eimeria mitis TaxID=44415 RepID=U6K8Z1_9EIME|nr:uncharacterized protein EMH_0001360 [Eimeria mitis]CDJ34399.1 hypothetical protein, conserved [Eimeria mitis]